MLPALLTILTTPAIRPATRTTIFARTAIVLAGSAATLASSATILATLAAMLTAPAV